MDDETSVLLISPKTHFSSDLEQILEEVPVKIRRAACWEDAETVLPAEAEAPELIVLACDGRDVDGLMICQELHSAAYNGYDRRIDVYMSRIRHKIGDNPASPSYLKTVRGAGYQLMAG